MRLEVWEAKEPVERGVMLISTEFWRPTAMADLTSVVRLVVARPVEHSVSSGWQTAEAEREEIGRMSDTSKTPSRPRLP